MPLAPRTKEMWVNKKKIVVLKVLQINGRV